MKNYDSTASATARLDWAARTDLGLRRKNNEDAWNAVRLGGEGATPLEQVLSALPEAGVLLILSDGMGGALAGEVASQFCVAELAAQLNSAKARSDPPTALREAFLATHALLAGKSATNADWKGMAATLSVLWLLPDRRLVLGHVGDSRIYRVQPTGLEQLTEDHNVGTGLVRRGEISVEDAARLKYRSLLEQVMGGDGDPINPQIRESAWESGDLYVLCSDGLYGPLGPTLASMFGTISHPPLAAAAEGLVHAANAAGGPDNITVILARLLPE